MTDSKDQNRQKVVDRRAPRADSGATSRGDVGTREGFVDLLKRSDKIGGRHAAITNSLYSWHSYKNWADKMRGSWEEKK